MREHPDGSGNGGTPDPSGARRPNGRSDREFEVPPWPVTTGGRGSTSGPDPDHRTAGVDGPGDRSYGGPSEPAPIRVLHVDDDPAFLDLTAASLERHDGAIAVDGETDPDAATYRLERATYDCLVTDYRMPGLDWIDLLRAVRDRHPDLPVILFTGHGSEDVASRAIEAGVTDYLRKGIGPERFEVLAVRIRRAVEAARTAAALRRAEGRYRELTEQELVGIYLVQDDEIVFANDRLAALLGYEPDELVGRSPLDFVAEADAARVEDNIHRRLGGEADRVRYSFNARRKDGAIVEVEVHGGVIDYRGRPAILGTLVAAEDAADAGERKFRSVFEGASDAMVIADDDGTIVDANPAAATMFGRDRESIVGRSIGAFTAADYEAEGTWGTFRDGATDTGIVPLVRPDGSRRLAEYAATTDVLPGRHLSILRDVTEREAAADRRRETNQTLKAVIRASPLAIVGLSPDGHVEMWNPAAERLFGWAEAEVLGEPFPAVPDDRRGAFREVCGRVMAGEAFTGVEVRRLTRGGDLIDLSLSMAPVYDDDGHSSGLVALFADVTDRKRRERMLETLHDATRELMRASSREDVAWLTIETLREVFDRPLAAIWFHDPAEDALVPVASTPAAREVVDELPRFTPEQSISWRVFESGEHAVHDDVTEVAGIYNPETAIRSEIIVPLGTHGVLNVGSTSAGAFDDADVSLVRIFAANVEVALDRARRERELREQRRELERQNDRLEEFASVVSHDLRNPLAVAQGNLELLADAVESEHIEPIRTAHRRMADLIDDLLTLARHGERVDDPEPVDLRAVARSAWETVDTRDATLVVPDAATILADRSRLAGLLENLFSNAVEHGGPDVTVTVGSTPEGFYVENDGPPIPEADRERVFDSGYTTAGDGTGFGLAIVAGIAAAHGWTVEATDGSTGGARFEFVGVDRPESTT